MPTRHGFFRVLSNKIMVFENETCNDEKWINAYTISIWSISYFYTYVCIKLSITINIIKSLNLHNE